MRSDALSIKSKTATKEKVNFFYYLIIFLVAGAFGAIVTKNISLPQMVIRPVGAAVITLLFYLAFFKPAWPLIALVAYAPFSRILVGDFGTMATALNLTNVLIFITFAAWVTQSMRIKDRFFSESTLNLPITLFCFWGIFSLLMASQKYGSGYAGAFIIPLKRWLTPVLLYFVVLNIVKDRKLLKLLLIVMMVVAAVIGLMAVWNYMNYGDRGSLEASRIGGVFDQPNTLGGFFVYTMFLYAGFFLVYFPNLKYWFFITPLLISFRGIMVTFSRGAYFGCAFGGLATAFFKSKILFIVCVIFLICSFLNPILLPAGIRARLGSTFYDTEVLTTDLNEVGDKSATGRITIWKGAMQMIKDYPLFGVGYGMFPYVISQYAEGVGYVDAHNTYLILGAEMGTPALIIFLFILFLMIKNARWLYRTSKDKFIRAFALGVLGGLFGLLVVNMFGSRLNSEEVSAYFWV